MSGVSVKPPRLVLTALLCVFWGNLAPAQQTFPPETVPTNFTADAAFAAHVRSLLLPYTKPATARYAVGQQVLETLLRQLPADRTKFSWDLRIAKGAGNVFSSPDGSIFVDEDLAQLMASRAGSSAGLWAAALSHEISHIVRRDWARRYLFQKSLEQAGASQLTLGDAGVFSGSWVDARGASSQLSSFCQTMELEADADGLMLMTRAGFDPDFVPALHHLLEGQPGQSEGNIFDPSHPRWNEREQHLQKLYLAAGKEYDRLWPDRYASPGGNSPTVVYAGSPSARRVSTGEMEVLIPLHCRNLVGSVEVVLRITAPDSVAPTEQRQFSGCTSYRTLITFTVPSPEARKGNSRVQAEVSVLDDNGGMLTHSIAPIPIR
ncbi:MAG: M48 family metalloprotease [Terriglobales bacterium]